MAGFLIRCIGLITGIILAIPLWGQTGRNSLFLFSQYQFAAGNRAGGEAITLSNGLALNSRIPYSTANGLSLHAGWSGRSDSLRLGYTAGLRFFRGTPVRVAEWVSDSAQGRYAYSTYHLTSLSADIGGFVYYEIGKLRLRTALGVLLPIYRRGAEHTEWSLTGFSGEEWREVKYRWSPGFRVGEEFRLAVSDHVWLCAGLELGFMPLARKSRNLGEYKDSEGKTAADIYPYMSDRQMDYLSDRELEQGDRINDPDLGGFDRNRPRTSGSFSEPSGYIALRFGMIWHL